MKEKLDMLTQWRDIEPRPGFEDRVWRPVRTVEPSRLILWLDALRDGSVLQPAYASAAAMVVGAAVGLAAMWLTVSPVSAGMPPEFNIYRTGSISGSYVQMVQGVQP